MDRIGRLSSANWSLEMLKLITSGDFYTKWLAFLGSLFGQTFILLSLAGSQLSPVCSELQQILEQYGQHKEQTTQQLEEAIRAQLGQQGARRGGQATQGAAINPALHPQYREELARMLSDLNAQYSQALEQRKEMIRQAVDRLR